MDIETEEERRETLVDLVQGLETTTDNFVYKIGTVRVEEKSGLRYVVRKVLLGDFNGSTTLSIIFEPRGTPPSEETINQSSKLAEGSTLRKKIGILTLAFRVREIPKSDMFSSGPMNLEEEYPGIFSESRRRRQMASVEFDTADVSEIENRLAVLSAAFDDAVSEEERLNEDVIDEI